MTKWTKEQEEAIYRSGTNIIVSAGAGSGKTAVLTERVLEKIRNGVSLDNLLILTFTKMAAKEMKERIALGLKKEGFKEEMFKIDTANITTFDAYSLSLVKKYSYLLNISSNISIIDSSIILLFKKRIVNEIFERLYEEENERFLKFVKEYSLKDDNELMEAILIFSEKLDLKPDKEKYLNNYINDYFNDDKINNDIGIYYHLISKKIDDIRENLEYIDDSSFYEKMYTSLKGIISSTNYDEVLSSLNIKLPIARGVSDEVKKCKEKIANLIKEITKLCEYNSILDIKKGILKTKNNIQVIIDILLELDNKVRSYKEKYDYYEYHDIANMAIKLVSEHDDIRKEIAGNLNEILIDEYQDTSDVQEKFISYISNNNVYMVGDIKQSIYRFRNANPYIFKDKYSKYEKNDGGIKIDLNKNFRSRREVIENINLIFDKIMDEDIGGASYSKSHQMIFGNMMYEEEGNNKQNNNFEVYNYLNDTIYKKEEIEAFIIARDIKNKINNGYLAFDKEKKINRKAKYSDFVILIDSSSSFELFKKILEYHNIPVSIMKASNLIQGDLIPIIKNIISLIIKIKDKQFDTEFKKLFISLSRSFLFSMDDNTIFNYFISNNFFDSEIYKKTLELASIIDTISLDNILDLIIEKYDFYEKLILIGDYNANISRIDVLKDITSNLSNLNYDIYDYQEYLTNIIDNNIKIEFKINDSSDNTVKIMTIHASKGLEFNICYFPLLYNKFNITEAINRFSYDNSFGMIIPYLDDFLKNTIYHNLSYDKYVKENIGERIRLFYVALTRAKEKMIFILPNDLKDGEYISDLVDNSIRYKYNSFASIFYSLKSVLMPYYKNIDLKEINLSKGYNLIKNNNYQKEINFTNEKILVDEIELSDEKLEESSFSKKSNELINEEAQKMLDYGKHLHEIFELVNFSDISLVNLTVKEKELIDNFVKQVDISNCNIYKEYEFIYEKDDITYHGIIDLMLEYNDRINIIDYKLKNIKDEAYLKQLGGYKDYIESVFNKKTNVYLYSIIDNKLEEL